MFRVDDRPGGLTEFARAREALSDVADGLRALLELARGSGMSDSPLGCQPVSAPQHTAGTSAQRGQISDCAAIW